jgi:hypothetical protein
LALREIDKGEDEEDQAACQEEDADREANDEEVLDEVDSDLEKDDVDIPELTQEDVNLGHSAIHKESISVADYGVISTDVLFADNKPLEEGC